MNLAKAQDWNCFSGRQSKVVAIVPVQQAYRSFEGKAEKAEGRAAMERASVSGDSALMAELLLAISERKDREAFHRLFNHFAPRMQAFLRRQGASADQAEEVVQEAMVTVWRKASLFDPRKASPATWIFTIARNQRIDLLRKANRPEPDRNDPAFEPAPEAQGDEALARKQDAARLKDAIAGLPEDQRAVLKLVYFKDKTHDEAAKELEIPLGTVKSRIRLAFRKMRTALGDNS
jgi:RNA polymerase sigma-70 factor (ECF subfamily)